MTDPPRFHGEPIGRAQFKSQSADFQVEEILGFEPSGEGEHCFLWLEKTDRNSNEVATHLADQLGIRKRLVSHCGLKDKLAVTRQWFSLHMPGEESPPAPQLEAEGIRILKITRNSRKLRRGSHDGNRFVIRLRDCEFSPKDATDRWEKIASHGVPNFFGSQRFGKNGDNLRQAAQMFSGELEIRDRQLRGIILSAARSAIFNAVIAERLTLDNWNRPIAGEIYGFADNRSLILPHNLHGDETDRFSNGDLELTAPLWGQGEPPSLSEVLAIEKEVATRHPDLISGLTQLNLRQERRTMRLIPRNSSQSWDSDGNLTLKFDLPKGTYATTLLREMVTDIQ